jgi:hypothetical protein
LYNLHIFIGDTKYCQLWQVCDHGKKSARSAKYADKLST